MREGDDVMTAAEEDNNDDQNLGDEITTDENGNPIPQKETSSQKVKKEKQALQDKKDNGEI